MFAERPLEAEYGSGTREYLIFIRYFFDRPVVDFLRELKFLLELGDFLGLDEVFDDEIDEFEFFLHVPVFFEEDFFLS